MLNVRRYLVASYDFPTLRSKLPLRLRMSLPPSIIESFSTAEYQQCVDLPHISSSR